MLISVALVDAKAQNLPLGIFDANTDVGAPNLKGSVTYNSVEQTFTMEGSGKNIWATEDEFHFLYKKLKGDFIVQATVQFVGTGVDAHRKIGWMLRETLDKSSRHISAVIHGDGLTSLQYRKVMGGEMAEVKSTVVAPTVVRLERKGNTFTMSVAKWGDVFEEQQIVNDNFANEVYAGLFVCSHNAAVVEKAIFSNVRITIPAADNFVPYKDFIGSHIEVLDVESGRSRIVYSSPKSLQAPNWLPNANAVIYNCEGLLYKLNLDNNTSTVINTDFGNNNNNDHVLSFDGKMMGISHHDKANNSESVVYTLPATGGVPKRITKLSPSYLHGWSPDGKYLVYTGQRNGVFDIYRIKSSGGKETQLTNATGLDDGSEYSPCGKYIYFNSDRTGTMQIWRMNADGSNQQQLTFDAYNDWFPHVSPDGKWVVFISYPKEIASNDHPFYKRVMIRLMPFDGGTIKTIAYLYGGQGTMNVPSWSPDSKRISFVSNTIINE